MHYFNANINGKSIAIGVWEQSGRKQLYSGQVFCPDCGDLSKTTHQSTQNKAKNKAVDNLKKHITKKHKLR